MQHGEMKREPGRGEGDGGFRRTAELFLEERRLNKTGFHTVAGVDEAGRGPLAGPVVAAAVIFPPYCPDLARTLIGVNDSKRLTAARRRSLFGVIRESALDVSIATVDPEDIDRDNILQATFRAMVGAMEQLQPEPQIVLVDGNRTPERWMGPMRAMVKGDSRSISIAAASIVAKVTRDSMMEAFHRKYPEYDFLHNKGYGTEVHLRALEQNGPCPVHRLTFCRSALERRRQGELFPLP